MRRIIISMCEVQKCSRLYIYAGHGSDIIDTTTSVHQDNPIKTADYRILQQWVNYCMSVS